MSTTTLISGQAGVAVHWGGGRASSFELDGGQRGGHDPREVARMFGDSSDVIAISGLRPDQVPSVLELEWSKQRCLTLCLIALDLDADEEARLFAVEDAEVFLQEPLVADFAASSLYAAPMPTNADISGAIAKATKAGSKRLAALLEEVDCAQDQIARCRAAWDAVPTEVFGNQARKEALAFDLVRRGVLRKAARTPAAEQNSLLLELLGTDLRMFSGWRDGLVKWLKTEDSSAPKARQVAEDEDEPTSKRPAPKVRKSADEVLNSIERQKEAIKAAIREGNRLRIFEFVEDLIRIQSTNSSPEQLAMSLCDLAQHAKINGQHQIQLELAERAVGVSPGDSWSLTQLGDARLLTGLHQEALAAYDLAWKHGAGVVARNGRAEVLKGLGRFDEALAAYESAVNDFPQNVVARGGLASVHIICGRYDKALSILSTSLDTSNWIHQHMIGTILLRQGQIESAVEVFERGVRNAAPLQRAYFRSSLGYAHMLTRQPLKALEDLADDSSFVSNVIRLDIFGQLKEIEKARDAYMKIGMNQAPRVIELTNELAARANLITPIAAARPTQWVLDREFELLLAA